MSLGPSTSRRLLGAAVALTAALFAPALLATSITGTIVATRAGGNINLQILDSSEYLAPKRIWGGQIEFTPTAGDFTGTLLPETSANVIAFCLEPEEHIGYASYTWQVSPLEQAGTGQGGIGVTRSRHIQDLLYHVGPVFGAGLLNNSQALALQISLWEIVRETGAGGYDLSSGNVLFTSTGSSTANNALLIAQGWLDSYVNDSVGGPYNKDLLALTRVGNQDLLVQWVRPVPAPASLLLFAPVLWLARRRTRAHR